MASAKLDLRLPFQASPPVDRYQIILLGDRGTRVWTTCPKLLPEIARPGVEPATFGVASPTPQSLRHEATQRGRKRNKEKVEKVSRNEIEGSGRKKNKGRGRKGKKRNKKKEKRERTEESNRKGGRKRKGQEGWKMKGIKRKSDGEERKEREGSEALAVQRYEKQFSVVLRTVSLPVR